MSQPAAAPKPERGLVTVAVIAGCVALFDALLAGQSLWAMLLVAIGILYYGLRALAARRRPEVGRLRAKKALAVVAIGVLALAFIRYDARLEDRRVADLIAAVDRYKATQGAYPAKLDALVPAFLAEVPRPRIAMAYGTFQYRTKPAPTLSYVVFPPFGRAIYHFDTRKTSYLD